MNHEKEINKILFDLVESYMKQGPDEAIKFCNLLEHAYISITVSLTGTLIAINEPEKAKDFYNDCLSDFERAAKRGIKLVCEATGDSNPWDANAAIRQQILKEMKNEDT